MALGRLHTKEENAQHAKDMKEYRRRNRAKYLERERRSKEKVPLYLRRLRSLNYNLSHQYGISASHYFYLLDKQDGCCAICRGHNGERRLDVDHDHNTGAVRGLLCHRCNQGMIAVDACPNFCTAATHYKEVTYRTL